MAVRARDARILGARGGIRAVCRPQWEQMAVTRPQLAGIACYVALLVLLNGRWTAAHWGAIPLLFLVWTNLHGSFVMGLGLMVCAVAGRAADLWFAGRGVKGLTHDGPLARLLVVTQLAFGATLVNPYGLALYHEVLPSRPTTTSPIWSNGSRCMCARFRGKWWRR